jgi:acyl-CoA hydrolase
LVRVTFLQIKTRFAPCGYPKVTPIEFGKYVEKNNLKLKFSICSGASVGSEIEDYWGKLNLISNRYPYSSGRNIIQKVNKGE